MAARLAEAVIEAHRRRVIHRDIKPGNVLWSREDDLLKLADFGIAAVLPLTVRDPSGMTLRSFYTRPFASPEQLLQKSPSFASDVYGFGLLIASLLALVQPPESFEPSELGELTTTAIAELRAEGISDQNLSELSATLSRTLAEQPSERPTMTELRDILARLSASLVPRPIAAMILTHTARKRLQSAGFLAEAAILDDFNSDLRVRLERTDRGESIRIFGRSLFAVLVLDRDVASRSQWRGDEVLVAASLAGQSPPDGVDQGAALRRLRPLTSP